jgi:hypothetical protein
MWSLPRMYFTGKPDVLETCLSGLESAGRVRPAKLLV